MEKYIGHCFVARPERDNTFWTDSTSQIRSYLEVDFLHDANTSIDMEVKISPLWKPEI